MLYSMDGGVMLERSLEEEIEWMREAMVEAAGKAGLTADETIEFSRRLDSLMNQYDALKEYN